MHNYEYLTNYPTPTCFDYRVSNAVVGNVLPTAEFEILV